VADEKIVFLKNKKRAIVWRKNINPDNQIAFILLANRVHTNDDGNTLHLRSFVANVVAAAFGR
jgi:hypothetical protein